MESATTAVSDVVPASIGGRAAAPDPRPDAAARIDRVNQRIAEAMALVHPAQLTLTRYQSLDAVGHYFLRYAIPSEFGDVTEEERRRLGARARAAVRGDRRRDRARDGGARPGRPALVVSGYGMEPLGLPGG